MWTAGAKYSVIILTALLTVTGIIGKCEDEKSGMFPDPEGYVSDYAAVLSGSDYVTLTDTCEFLDDDTGVQLVIVIIDTLGDADINTYATDLFNEWGIGHEDADNGLLFSMAVDDHKWVFRAGYGMEKLFPDVLCRHIVEESSVGEFQARNYGEGLINLALRVREIINENELQPGKSTGQSKKDKPSHRINRPGSEEEKDEDVPELSVKDLVTVSKFIMSIYIPLIVLGVVVIFTLLIKFNQSKANTDVHPD
ncbi:MAG TPA: TPM domain-containing protein [bacterium]